MLRDKLASKPLFYCLVGIGVLFPLFFTLSGGVYRDAATMIDSQGIVTRLPLPVSILTCLVILLLLLDRLPKARIGLAMVTATIVASLISLWLASDGITTHNRKLIMSIQVVLPLIGLLVGLLVGEKKEMLQSVALGFLLVLSLIVPVQLLATWKYGAYPYPLVDYLYFFTIYSHIQYVTLILVCAFAFSLACLWPRYRLWLSMMLIVMLVYTIRSQSYLTMTAYGMIVLAFAASIIHRVDARAYLPRKFLAIVLSMSGIAFLALSSDKVRQEIDGFWHSSRAYEKFSPLIKGEIPSNLLERIADWQLFGRGIVETPKTLLVGHPQPMPREIRTSPHNWYLDIAYTYGVIGLLPMLILIGHTANRCWHMREGLTGQTGWLAGIVFYLIVIDSNFKVTLRQPYPGIFAFFMWGMLLAQLGALRPGSRGQG